MNTLALEASFPGFSINLGSGPIGVILALVFLVLWLLATIEGSTAVFRGLRDIITARRGDTKPNGITRVMSGFAVFTMVVTGAAFFAGFAVWISGTTFIFSRKGRKKTNETDAGETAETESR